LAVAAARWAAEIGFGFRNLRDILLPQI